MFKKTSIIAVAAFSMLSLQAQHTLEFTQPDKLFHEGKEMYNQRKWSASYRDFEDYLKTAKATDAGMIQEAEYYRACNAYELRQSNASKLLEQYLTLHPYTPYYDRTLMMLGMLEYEAKQYDKALEHFRLVDETNLTQSEKDAYLFSRGYANIETNNIAKALDIFKTLKQTNASNLGAARYYAGYCEYRLGNYEAALPDLLAVEQNPEFENIAPYYVAQIYYSKKNFGEMESRAQSLLKKYPDNINNAEIYRMLGEKAYSEGNYAKAIDNLKKYEAIFPQVLRNDIYYLGVSYLKTGQAEDAVKYLSQVTTDDDEMSESAYLQLGNAYIDMDKKDNARMAYEAALRTNFNTKVREEALFNYALTSYETNTAFGESVKAFEQFIQEFPQSNNIDKAYDYLSTVYLTSKNYSAAYESILRIKNLTPKLRETKQYLEYQLGTESFAASNYTVAIEQFTKAIQTAPQGKYIADSYFWRGEAYYRVKDYSSAATDLINYFKIPNIKTNPNYNQAYYALGYAFFGQKNYNESLNWFLKYVGENQNNTSSTYADALNRIGDAYFSSRNFGKADEYYKKAVNLNYNGDYAMFQSAYLAGLNKNYSQKIGKLEEMITKYPSSEYGDDAMYEIGRSYLMLENNAKAIETYNRLIERYPNSILVPKAELETGMIHYNQKQYEQAGRSYKKVIAEYPGSDEANTALESLEAISIETNNVDDYLSYAKSLGKNTENSTLAKADSISFIVAEKQFIEGNTNEAIRSFGNYMDKYCPGGKYCTLAQYYIADLYYTSGDKANALKEYEKMLNTRGNPYIEEAAIRSAEITFDNKDYTKSLSYFKRLEMVAQSTENKNIARLGIMRTSNLLNNNSETVKIAEEIISDHKSDATVREEALLNRAKAYVQMNNLNGALKDLKAMNIDTRTAIGAEAKFTLSDVYYKLNRLNEAEKEVFDFAKKGSAQQYWLARGFIILADVNIQKGDDFQAKQYLLSLQKNYTTNDEVQTMITERLNKIDQRSKAKIIK